MANRATYAKVESDTNYEEEKQIKNASTRSLMTTDGAAPEKEEMQASKFLMPIYEQILDWTADESTRV